MRPDGSAGRVECRPNAGVFFRLGRAKGKQLNLPKNIVDEGAPPRANTRLSGAMPAVEQLGVGDGANAYGQFGQ